MAPIPGPGREEKQDAFHSRCMSDEIMKREFPDMKQRNAVCFSKWREHEKNNQFEEEVVNMKVTVCDLIANKHTQFTEADKEWLSALTEDQLQLLAPVNIPEVKANAEPPKQPTYEELLAAAPPEVRARLDFVDNMHKAQREELITKIKANKSAKFTDDQLNAMSDDLLKTTAESFAVEASAPSYVGSFGTFTPPVDNADKEEPLSLPTLEEKK